MKKLLLIVLPLLFFTKGFSQNRVNVKNLVQYGEKYFKENDDRPFNGIVFDMSKETGNKILQYKIVDGLKNGLYQEWYPDGKPKSKGKYLNNILVGDWAEWYPNCNKKEERTYKNGKIDGLVTKWHGNGQKNILVNYKDGVKIENLYESYEYNEFLTSKQRFIIGESVWATACFQCHRHGTNDAVIYENRYYWDKSAAKGFYALNKNIWEGYVGKKEKYPAKGFCNLCEEDEIKESVLYTFHLIRKIQALKSKNN